MITRDICVWVWGQQTAVTGLIWHAGHCRTAFSKWTMRQSYQLELIKTDFCKCTEKRDVQKRFNSRQTEAEVSSTGAVIVTVRRQLAALVQWLSLSADSDCLALFETAWHKTLQNATTSNYLSIFIIEISGEIPFLSNALRFSKKRCFLECSQISPVVLLVRAVCMWR
jgi:hypothetical protein